jgi:hypothetical protein
LFSLCFLILNWPFAASSVQISAVSKKNFINLKIFKILKFSGKNKEIETKEEEYQPGAGDPQILVFYANLIHHE